MRALPPPFEVTISRELPYEATVVAASSRPRHAVRTRAGSLEHARARLGVPLPAVAGDLRNKRFKLGGDRLRHHESPA